MPTQLKSKCPKCGLVVKITDVQLGRQVRCPGCKAAFELSSLQMRGSTPSLEQAPEASETMEGKAADTSSVPLFGAGSIGGINSGRLGRFELKELLGQGAFGRVYRAYDPQLDRLVALKVPTFGPEDQHKIQRFIAEAKAAAKLRHPNIVPTYESGQIDGQYYIAAQFVAGQPLAKRIKESAHDFRQAAEWVRQLAEGLVHAHQQGIVHRDIKPDNVMLDEHGVPQIMDFGLAKRLNEDSAMTTDGSLLGTPAYMAPEQARGEHKNVGPPSDQYSLGVVLYELLTGKKPFEGSPHSVIAQVIAKEPATPRSVKAEIPEDLEAICQIAMNKSAAERYASCADLSSDLARWLGGYETHARPLSRTERAWRWCRRNAVVAGLAAAVVLLLTFGLATTGTLVWVFTDKANRVASVDDQPTTKTATRTEAVEPVPISEVNKISDGKEASSLPLEETHVAPAAPIVSDIPPPPDTISDGNAPSLAPEATPGTTSVPVGRAIPPPPGLIAWWSGDRHVNDSVGNHSGTVQGYLSFAPGLVGQAFSFNGINLVRVPHDPALNPGPVFTIECWIRSNAPDSVHTIVDVNAQAFFGESRIAPLTWVHTAATFDRQKAKIYYNGVLDTEEDVSQFGVIHHGTTDLFLGTGIATGGRPSSGFYGLIDELSLYDRALSADEIASIYRAGSAGKIKPSAQASAPTSSTASVPMPLPPAAKSAASPPANGSSVSGSSVDGGFVTLFDGKTLTGWSKLGGNATFRAEGGMIVGTTGTENSSTYLTCGNYADFDLEFDVLCDKPLEAGVLIRSHRDTSLAKSGQASQMERVVGYECEITKAERGRSGNFFDYFRRNKLLDDLSKKPKAAKAYADGEWNHFRIVAQGDHIQSWVNGVTCADFRDTWDSSGFVALQIHGIPAGTGPFKVRWRNIRIRELKAQEASPPLTSVPRKEPSVTSGFDSIFNGHSFAGWRKEKGNPNSFQVKNGAIVADGKLSHLFYVASRPYKNFHFACEVMTRGSSNGGIYFHTKYQDSGYLAQGLECNIYNANQRDAQKTGSLYGLAKVLQSPVNDDEWFQCEIIVEGKHVVIKVNDKVTADYVEPAGGPATSAKSSLTAPRLGEGTFALQAHGSGGTVHYRNIRVKRLPDTPTP